MARSLHVVVSAGPRDVPFDDGMGPRPAGKRPRFGKTPRDRHPQAGLLEGEAVGPATRRLAPTRRSFHSLEGPCISLLTFRRGLQVDQARREEGDPPRIARRFLFRMIGPVVAVSLLLLALGASSAWYVHRLQRDVTNLLSRDVSSNRAAEELVITFRQIEAHGDGFMLTGSPDPPRRDLGPSPGDRAMAGRGRAARLQRPRAFPARLPEGGARPLLGEDGRTPAPGGPGGRQAGDEIAHLRRADGRNPGHGPAVSRLQGAGSRDRQRAEPGDARSSRPGPAAAGRPAAPRPA